jgi:hypothetical protein
VTGFKDGIIRRSEEILEVEVATRATKRRLTVGGAPNGILYRSAP